MNSLWIICTVLLVSLPLQAFAATNETIEVFVIPHTHDDVGWIVTLESYYTSEVQYIIDTMLQELENNPNRRFIYVEMAYLKRWWDAASENDKSRMKKLHQNKQLEFILGGIVMSDEAAASYVARVNQLQEGHRFLLENFGAIPNIGWQIDPFGSSRGTPTLFAKDCYDALVIQRIPYQEKSFRQNNLTMEFIWHGTNNLGQETDMFTHIMDEFAYCTPSPFAWGNSWNIYQPPNPNPPVTALTLPLLADAFVHNVKKRAAWFRTNKLLWPFGCDFQYQNAIQMFKNMDQLLDYVNQNSERYGIKAAYHVLSDYFEAIKNDNPGHWPDWSYDFFPYADNDLSFWTGYYTSRNALKIDTRKADHVLRSADVSTVLAMGEGKFVNQKEAFQALDSLRFESGVSQHHDAVSGTARPQVIYDYRLRLNHGMKQCDPLISENLSKLLSKQANSELPILSSDEEDLMGTLSMNQTGVVVVFNSLSWNRTDLVDVQIPDNMNVIVTNSNNSTVVSQIVEMNSETHLFFLATVGPVGYSSYFVTPTKSSANQNGVSVLSKTETMELKLDENNDQATTYSNITNGIITLTISSEGAITNIYNTNINSKPQNITNTLMFYYESSNETQPSGAYIFVNNGTAQSLLQQVSSVRVTTYKGPVLEMAEIVFFINAVLSEFHTVPTNHTQLVKLVYSSDSWTNDKILVTNQLGPISGNNAIISRWNAPWSNNRTIYQDDSGFLTLKRYYNESQTLPIPGNYYPMVMQSFIDQIGGENIRISVLTAQSEGCASQINGSIEHFLHRRTLQDDYRGVDCPLNDTNRIETKHYILIDKNNTVNDLSNRLKIQLNFPFQYVYGSADAGGNKFRSDYNTVYSALSKSLPDNIHILHLELYDGTSNNIVLRLQNIYEIGEGVTSPKFSVPTSVNITGLFHPSIVVTNVTAMTLSANQPLSKCTRTASMISNDDTDSTQSSDHSSTSKKNHHPSKFGKPLNRNIDNASGYVVTINPSDIQTFFINLKQ